MRSFRIDVLGINNFLDDGRKCCLNVSISQLGIRRRVGNRLLAEIIEVDNHLQHTHRLGKWTGVVIIGESVLRKEILTNELCHFHNNLLILRKRFLTDKLDNLGKVVFLLEDGTSLVTQVRVLFIQTVEVWFEYLHVLRVRNEPVKTGEMLSLSKLLIETPKHLDDRQSGSRDRV